MGKGKGLTLVAFTMKHCPPCKRMLVAWRAMQRQYPKMSKHMKLVCQHDQPAFVAKMGISMFPTICIMQGNTKRVARMSLPKDDWNVPQLKRFADKHIG